MKKLSSGFLVRPLTKSGFSKEGSAALKNPAIHDQACVPDWGTPCDRPSRFEEYTSGLFRINSIGLVQKVCMYLFGMATVTIV